MAESELMQAAIEYAQQGFAVFPLMEHDKYPIYSGGFKIATTNVEQVGKWWRARPNANIGIATGQRSGGVIVIDLDVDDDKGVNGYETLRDWERSHGELPDTANTITGRGGYHMLYRAKQPVKCRTGILPGIDIRGDGGYIVAPPSLHPNGTYYEWEQTIDEFGIAPVNNTVTAFLASGDTGEDMNFVVPNQIPSGSRNDTLFRMGCSMQAKQYSDEAVRAVLEMENNNRCVPPLEPDELEKIIKSVLKFKKGKSEKALGSTTDNADGFILPKASVDSMLAKKPQRRKDENGVTKVVWVVQQTIDNFATVMRNDTVIAGKLKYDVVAHAPKYFGQLKWRATGDTMGEWTDFDDANLKAYIESTYGLHGENTYNSAIEIIVHENEFNPIVSYLESLPEWDGKERIRHLIPRYLGADESEYTYEATKLFMFGALSRAYYPGCKFDYMLVLVGEQGVGKSAFLRFLAMQDAWFDDNLNTVEGKEAVERLRGKWILELAELLAVKRQRDVETIKAFITTQSDSYREPYARRTTDRKRFCVFAATTNDYNFLTDRTGNRRFLPVEVHGANRKADMFENEAETKAYFEQAWAEALKLFKDASKRPRLVLPQKIQDKALSIQQKYLEEDVWIGIIRGWLSTTEKERVCTMDLWQRALDEPGKPKRAESNRLHAIMRQEMSDEWTECGVQDTGEYGNQKCYKRKLKWLTVDDDEGF